jgi:hypothetical protein
MLRRTEVTTPPKEAVQVVADARGHLMKRLFCGALALALAACSLSVFAGTPRQDDSSAPSMRFTRFQEGPADACVGSCRTFIQATGMISAETPRDFDTFIRSQDLRGATFVLDSKGGSVHGAMALGRAIRALGLTTTVGRVKEVASNDGQRRGALSPRGECQSMCAFVVLGGARRFVPPESRVLVHQIWLGDRRDDAAAAQYTAEDLVLVQRDIGRLVQYTSEMGGGTELIEVALRIPPWEPMRALSRDELRRTRIDTGPDRSAQVPAPSAVTTAAVPVANAASAEIAERGWALSQRDGVAALVRQHPLTVEGERIGIFEIALNCGTATDTFDVTYTETRRNTGGVDAALKQVDLSIEGQSASLEIVSSRRTSASRELQTRAAGTLTAAALKSFAETSVDSLTVQTASTITPATVIRVGSVGFARGLPHLASACGHQSNQAHAQLDPTRVGGEVQPR